MFPPSLTCIKFDVFGCQECGVGKKLTTVGRDPRCGAVNLFIVLWLMTMADVEERSSHTVPVWRQWLSCEYIVIQALISYRSPTRVIVTTSETCIS